MAVEQFEDEVDDEDDDDEEDVEHIINCRWLGFDLIDELFSKCWVDKGRDEGEVFDDV